MENSRVLFRPYASIIPADTNEPIGVAKECIDAECVYVSGKKGKEQCDESENL
jgi:hypothetical protein